MSDHTEDHSTPAASDAPPSLDHLPVQVNFELGSLQVALGTLKSLAPGYVFELSHSENKTVRLTVNGQTVGYGELVKIGTRSGVRVIELASQ